MMRPHEAHKAMGLGAWVDKSPDPPDPPARAQEKIWCIEHQIRTLTKGRGMRPGKAIRRVLGTTDAQTQALAGLWLDGSFGVAIGADPSLFKAGYDHVRSCMQGHGDVCHASYTPHGVTIATAMVGWRIVVARSLVYEPGKIYIKAYGEQSFALQTLLEIVCGLFPGSLKGYEFADQIGVWDYRTEVIRTITLPEVCTFAADSREAQFHPLGSYDVVKVEREVEITKCAKRAVFRPHLD